MNRLFVAMDVHKENIVVIGLPKEEPHPVVREEFGGGEISRLVKRFKTLSRTWQVETCYEAGPSGYGLARVLLKAGISCGVVAPTLIPRRPGNRVKTDARDARELALALRAGTLEFVRIPTLGEEEVRALVRCREDIARQVRIFKTTISHWLHSRDHRVPSGLKRWTPAYWKWVRALPLSPMDRLTLDHYLDVLSLLEDQRRQVEEQICELAKEEPYRERVKTLGALRGFSPLAAMRLIAEVMVFERFASAPSFMKFTGLTPSEHSSGNRIRRGKITKAGNSHIRHVLVEAVQKAHISARPGRALLRRWQEVSGPLRQIALNCLKRLHHKFWSLTQRGVSAGMTRVAMARELAGFVWALMTHQEREIPAVA
jgi:transposase